MGIKKVLKKIAWPFIKLGKVLFGKSGLDALKAAGKALLNSALGKIVWSVVAELEASNFSNEEKRAAAFARIALAAKDAGLDVKASFINLLIELAVQRLKGVVPQK